KVESEIGSKIEDKLQPTSGGTIAGKLDSKLAEVAFKLQGIAAKLEGVAGKIEPQAGAGAGIDVEGMAFKLEDIAASLRGTAGKLHDPAHFIGTEKNLAGLPRLSPGAEALTVDGIAGEAERGVTPRGEGAPAAKVESKIELGGPQGLLPTGDEGESDG
ncbi:MAG TPA: hypothetical protein VMT16_12215, partial [Thermoanaerobaculia bacterium]|nr:hypothetical protein [Thermoanaerobaculia bacterium]